MYAYNKLLTYNTETNRKSIQHIAGDTIYIQRRTKRV